MRKTIIAIGYTEWKKMGFSKGTLHYMKKNAEADKPFILNAHGRERLDLWGEDADIEELQRKYLYAYSTSKP